VFEDARRPVDTVIQMMRAHSFRGRGGMFPAAVFAVLALALPAAAAAVPAPRSDGTLSPRLSELAQPALRSASPARQAAALSLAPHGSGSLQREGNRVLVDVRFERGAAASLGDLRAVGAKIVHLSRRYQTVAATVKPVDLRAVGAVPRIAHVSAVLAPVVRGADCGGAVRSEGDGQLNAVAARSAFGVDGSGVEVGILSDSFDRDGGALTHAAGDVASGDLPGPGSPCGSTNPVGVLDDSIPGADEGRAMGQIVHDLAPGASLSFASAFGDLFSFADNVRNLRAAGADVIVDDVFYPEEPFFQEGPVDVAVDQVTASGASYFSAAGNDNLREFPSERDIGSWEAPAYRDSGSCPTAIVELSEAIEAEEGGGPGLNPNHCMDFDPGPGTDPTFGITVEDEEELKLDLQWAESFEGVGTDLDAFLLDEEGKIATEEVNGNEVPVESADPNVESGEPIEFFRWLNETGKATTVQLVVNRFEGGDPRLKFALLQNGGGVSAFEYPESSAGDVVGPTVFGHAGAPAAIAVGAIRYNSLSAPEPFSSRGPLTHYFGPWDKAGPAAPIAPQAISKPDLTATDGGANTFFGPFFAGALRFFGTSAAAPHAAAVAALMKQANPSLSVTQLRSALAATARPVGSFGPNAVGAGLVDAYAAVSSIAGAPMITITERPPALGRDRQPSTAFIANRPVAFSCSLDGSVPAPCSSPFVPAPLSDGLHGFVVQGVDAAGRVGRSETVEFRIDTKRPRTFFRKHPPKVLRTHTRRAKAVFRFGSNEPNVIFACKVDGGFLRFCKERMVRRFRIGKHVVSVKARDAAGNVDNSPAVFRFKVKGAR
jgi:Subtilase family